MFRLNPQLANRVVLPMLEFVQPVLVPLAIAAAIACGWSFWRERDSRTELWTEKRPRLALLFGALAILMPVLGLVSLGLMAAIPTYSRMARIARRVLLVMLWAIAVELLFSLG